MKYNELPAHSSWAFKKDAARLHDENMATYEALRKVCTHGDRPIGGMAVVRELTPGYACRRYQIVSNPIRLDSLHMALYCDGGGLCFGYRVENSVIVVYTD